MDDNDSGAPPAGGLLGGLMDLWARARAPVMPLPTPTLPSGDPKSQAAYEGFDPTDIGMSAKQGLYNTLSMLGGVPGDWLHLAYPTVAPSWGSEQILQGLGASPPYQPQTGIGQMAQTAGAFAPGLAVGAPALLARGTEIGEGMEAADQFFNKLDPWNWINRRIGMPQ
jgi:hypothetical protein